MVSKLKLYLNVDCKNKLDTTVNDAITQNKDLKVKVFKHLYNLGYNPYLSIGFTNPDLDRSAWKKPIGSGWNKYAEERLPKKEFEKQCKLLELEPKYNIGLITKFNGLVVYDVDSFEYADAVEEAYINTFGTEPVGDTYIEKSKRGFKIYFKVIDLPHNASSLVISRSPELARYCGKYVICFPSIHTSSEDGEVFVYLPVSDVNKTKLKTIGEFKEITYEQMLEFEENLRMVLGISGENEDPEFTNVEFTPVTERTGLSGDIIEDTAKRLAEVIAPLWVEGQRWAVVLALSYFFARLTKVTPQDASSIIYKMATLLNTDEKRAKELAKKVYNAYKRVEKGQTIAYKTFLKECGVPEHKIDEFKSAVIKTFITTLKDFCNAKYAHTKFFAEIPINYNGEVIGKVTMEKAHAKKYLLTFIDNNGNEVGKKLVTIKQMYDEKTYSQAIKRLGVPKNDVAKVCVDLITAITSTYQKKIIERARELAAAEVFSKIEDLNKELAIHKMGSITKEDLDNLFEYDSETDQLKLSFSAMGDLMIRIFNAKTIIETKDIYIYIDGIYKNNEKAELSIEYVIRKLGDIISSVVGKDEAKDMITKNFIAETLAYIEDMAPKVSIKDFDDYSKYIPVDNGIVDIDEGKLLPHSPEFLFTWKLPVKYDENAECPQIEKFINSLVKPEDVDLLWKIIAYCLIPKQPCQCWFILVGSGQNGKSTYLRLLETFLGKENVSHVPLQTLESEKFARVQIVGKLANIYADLPREALKSTGVIKAFTGEDSIYVEPKFKEGFSYEPNAKLIFSANELPEVPDESHGFWRRVVMIEFPYIFERDDTLFSRITTEEELSGLLNKALYYIKKIKEEGIKTTTGIKELWMRKTNPLRSFVQDHIKEEEGCYVRKKELFEAYMMYCKKWGINNKYLIKGGHKLFFRDLYEVLDGLGIQYNESRITLVDDRERVLTNIKLVNTDELEQYATKPSINVKEEILTVLRETNKPLTVIEIVDRLKSKGIEIDELKVEEILNDLWECGEVFEPVDGKYTIL